MMDRAARAYFAGSREIAQGSDEYAASAGAKS